MPLFFLFFMLFMALLHYFIYKRFALRCEVCTSKLLLMKYVLIGNFLAIMGYVLYRAFEWHAFFYFVGSLALGVVAALVVMTLVYELLMLAHSVLPLNTARRNFLKKSSDYGALAIAGAYTSAGIVSNLQEPQIVPVTLKQGVLENPVRIVQLSDLHITQALDSTFIQRLVTRIEALSPDIIAITGDLIDAKVAHIQESLAWLGALKARHGVYFVTGNHEFYIDAHAITNHLTSLGIHVMDNKSMVIESLGLNIVGLPDFEAKRFAGYPTMNISQAIEGIVTHYPTLMLVHQPRAIAHFEGFLPHLALCGHTHGGQIFPFNFLVRLQQPFVKGLHQYDLERYIYINSGTGYWGPPMRLGTVSEVTCIDWS